MNGSTSSDGVTPRPVVHDEQVYLTPKEAAAYLGVRPRTIYLLVEQGVLPRRRLGKRLLRFTRADLDAALTAASD